MTYVTLAEAQATLPDLIAATQRGEQVVITEAGAPVATIQSSNEESIKPASGFGCLKGKIWISDDFDEPLEDFAEYM